MQSSIRIFDIISQYEKREDKRNSTILAIKTSGKWQTHTVSDYRNFANKFSNGLLSLGIKKGDKIATITNNRPEWNFADMGILQIGAVHVPVYPTISPEEFHYTLEHCEAKYIFVAGKLLYNKLKPIVDDIEQIKDIYTFDNLEEIPNWKEVLDLGEKYSKENPTQLDEIKDKVEADDLASIIYTSGTTGTPKGVMLTHKNFMSNVEGCKHMLELIDDKMLSFLPLCHVFERMVNYAYQNKGISIYYAENFNTIARDLRDITAEGFVTVPRVLEKVYNKIIAKGKDLKGIKKQVFFWAVNLGLKYNENPEKRSWWYEAKLKLANKLVFKKWREALGGNIRMIISGGAALQPRIVRVFWAAGLPLYTGYGLTETSPVISVTHPPYPNLKFGTVGPVLKNVEVKIAEDGEILCKGPNIMKGYFKDEENTKKTIDAEGWLHTGDIGTLQENNILKITDRKKEIFKLSGGKYVAPQPIENHMKESMFIEQIMVVGENERFTAAIISPDFSFLHSWCGIKKIKYRDNNELISNPKVIARIQKEINLHNKELGHIEKIKHFCLVTEEWTSENRLLSPTLKLKRRILSKKYAEEIKKLYEIKNKKNGKNNFKVFSASMFSWD